MLETSRVGSFAHLQSRDVVWQFVPNSWLNVHNIVFSEQVSQLLFVFIDHLNNPAKY